MVKLARERKNYVKLDTRFHSQVIAFATIKKPLLKYSFQVERPVTCKGMMTRI